MTAVAVFFGGPKPVMLGDMLVSGQEAELPLPAIGDIGNLFPDGHAIAGLCQKITILRDDCMLGWAGTWYVANSIISELSALIQASGVTVEIIENFLGGQPAETWEKLDVILMIAIPSQNGDHTIHTFERGATRFPGTEDLGEVWAIGTGVPAVKQAIHLSANIGIQNDLPLEAVVAKVWVLAAYLLRSEHADGNPIVEHAIGGAYEVATFRTKFGKFSDVGHVSYNVTVRHNGHIDIGNPMFALRLGYWKDFALVRSMRIDAYPETGTAAIPDNRLQVVPECTKFFKVKPHFPHYFPLNAIHTYHSFHLIFESAPGKHAVACMLEINNTEIGRLVHFLDPTRGIGLTYSPDYLVRIGEYLGPALANLVDT